jgi:hypothetical protein
MHISSALKRQKRIRGEHIIQCPIRSERIGNSDVIIRSYGNVYVVDYRHMQILYVCACVNACGYVYCITGTNIICLFGGLNC